MKGYQRRESSRNNARDHTRMKPPHGTHVPDHQQDQNCYNEWENACVNDLRRDDTDIFWLRYWAGRSYTWISNTMTSPLPVRGGEAIIYVVTCDFKFTFGASSPRRYQRTVAIERVLRPGLLAGITVRVHECLTTGFAFCSRIRLCICAIPSTICRYVRDQIW